MSDASDSKNSATNDSAATKKEPASSLNSSAEGASSAGGGGGAVFFSVFLSLAASGALVVGAPYWVPFTEKIIELPNPIKKLETETARVGREVVSLDGKIGAMSADSAKTKEQLAAASAMSAGVKTATLALAGAQLRSRLNTGEPYEFELAAVRAVAKGDAEVNALLDSVAKNAASGVATRPSLRETFPRAVAAVVAMEAETATKSAAGWFSGVGALIGQLGLVMQVSAPPEGSVHAIVRQARTRLAAGDLAGAVEELGTLPSPRVLEADEWLANARARLAVDKANSALSTLVLARLAALK